MITKPRLVRAHDDAPTLDAVLAFECPMVLYKFQESYDVTLEEASEIFTEVLKWLWLSDRVRREGIGRALAVTTELVILDEMWHTFVLFTREYHAFCERYFGRFLHHAPTTKTERDAEAQLRAASPRKADRARRARKLRQYRLVARILGVDTLRRWYIDFPERFARVLAERRPHPPMPPRVLPVDA